MPPARDVEKVADHRACWRGHNSHAARKRRQGPFAFFTEKPFGFQPFFQLLEGELQRSRAHRLHGFGHQLHLATLLVYAHAAAHQHMQPVLGPETEQHRLPPEQDHRQLCLGIF